MKKLLMMTTVCAFFAQTGYTQDMEYVVPEPVYPASLARITLQSFPLNEHFIPFEVSQADAAFINRHPTAFWKKHDALMRAYEDSLIYQRLIHALTIEAKMGISVEEDFEGSKRRHKHMLDRHRCLYYFDLIPICITKIRQGYKD